MDLAILAGFLAAAVRVSTPLLLAALGEMLAERGGVINLGIEGAMLSGALAGALAAPELGPWAGMVVGAGAGLLTSLAFVAVAVLGRADQIIAGTAVTLGAIGVTGVVYRETLGGVGGTFDLPTLGNLSIPGLSGIPVLGEALFAHPAPTYLAWALVPATWWLLFRTRWGLHLRATGEAPEAARASGVRIRLVQSVATLLGGAMAGLGGATLVLAQVGTFAERMTSGRGFIAIAVVVLGRWHPVWVLVAALLFGGATALQFLFQALGLEVPYQFFLMLPYLLALVALAGGMGRARAPAGLAK